VECLWRHHLRVAARQATVRVYDRKRNDKRSKLRCSGNGAMGQEDDGDAVRDYGGRRPTGLRHEQVNAAAGLEHDFAALKSKHVARAQRQLTSAQHATFAAFLAHITLESLCLVDSPDLT
jgi:hypothetical protein